MIAIVVLTIISQTVCLTLWFTKSKLLDICTKPRAVPGMEVMTEYDMTQEHHDQDNDDGIEIITLGLKRNPTDNPSTLNLGKATPSLMSSATTEETTELTEVTEHVPLSPQEIPSGPTLPSSRSTLKRGSPRNFLDAKITSHSMRSSRTSSSPSSSRESSPESISTSSIETPQPRSMYTIKPQRGSTVLTGKPTRR